MRFTSGKISDRIGPKPSIYNMKSKAYNLSETEKAKIGEIIMFKSKKLKVIATYKNSVVAEFLEYPVEGLEGVIRDRRIVLNHKRYSRTKYRRDKK